MNQRRGSRKAVAHFSSGISRLFPASGLRLLAGNQRCNRRSVGRTENLETRLYLSATFTVTTTADSGPGSFRDAIDSANSTPGVDTVEFNIPGSGVHTIQPLTALPAITDPVILDATSQPGYAGTPLIELDGSLAGPAVNGLHVTAGNSTIRGFAINRFQIGSPDAGHGIKLETGGGNIVQANFLGTDPSGTVALGNEHYGLRLRNSSNNLIGTNGDGVDDDAEGNLISGNPEGGMYVVSNSSANKISGNLIGTDVTGTAALGNGGGVFVDPSSTGNIIGTDGTGDAFDVHERNIVAGNTRHELSVYGHQSTVAGNFIGTDVTGTTAIESSDPGWAGIQIGGNDITVGTDGDGIADAVEGNLISGIYYGLELRGESTVVAGNRIGTDVTGHAALPNRFGIHGVAGTAFNRIGTDSDGVSDELERNVISGNTYDGVRFSFGQSHDNVIAGNFVGTEISGTGQLANGRNGITINSYAAPGRSYGNLIGTDSDGVADDIERNVVSGNGRSGIEINDAEFNTIAGNFVGTDVTGTVALPNNSTGIYVVNGAGNLIGTNGDGVNDGVEGNLISGNRSTGVYLRFSSDNVVAGNLIGTDATGTQAIPGGSGANGIGIVSSSSSPASGNRIGTNADGLADADEANVISGNSAMGVSIWGLETTGNVVAGNFIGTDRTGTLDLGNGDLYPWKSAGVVVYGGASSNTIGGTASGAGNTIAFNDGNGVHVVNGSIDNAILGNSIYGNDERGIDLDLADTTPGDGVSANDVGDADAGPNNLQNYPTVVSVTGGGGSATIDGELSSTPGTVFRIEFFSSPTADPSGHGEGRTMLGFANVTTSAAGTATFSANVAANVPSGHVVSATATDPAGNTSEFSAVYTTSLNQPPEISADNAAVVIGEGLLASNTGTVSDPDGDAVTFTASAGTVVDNNDGTWSWSLNTTDGPDDSQFVTITATDSNGVSDETTFNLTVDNVAPSLSNDGDVTVDEGATAISGGSYSDPGDDTVSLSASVGTVVDNGNGTWSWSFDTSDGPDESQLVTITATDSDGASSETTFDLTVNNVAPVVTALATDHEAACASSADGLVSVSGTFADPGLDTHAVSVDWGDGTVENVSVDQLADRFNASHEYSSGGVYVVTATATDSDGAVSDSISTTAVIQGTGLVDGTLYVIGTAGKDIVNVSQTGRRIQQIKVIANLDVGRGRRGGADGGWDRGSDISYFAPAEVQRIEVHLCDGDDHLVIGNGDSDGGLDIPTLVFGGAGNDHLTGGVGNDILIGGSGNDRINGRGGHDVLSGGSGNDWLDGGRGLDILIGGIGRDRLNGGRDADLLIGGSSSSEADDDRLSDAIAAWASGDLADALLHLGTISDDLDHDRLLGGRGVDELIGGIGDRLWR